MSGRIEGRPKLDIARAAPDAWPDPSIRLQPDGAEGFCASENGPFRRYVPAGDVSLTATLSNLSHSGPLTILAGQTLERDLVPGLGELTAEVSHEGEIPVSGGLSIEGLSARADLAGARQSFGKACQSGARFKRSPGDYLLRAALGGVMREQPVSVTAGQAGKASLSLAAGILSVTIPTGACLRSLPPRPIARAICAASPPRAARLCSQRCQRGR